MSTNEKIPNYYQLIIEQDKLFDKVEPYIYMDGIIPKVQDDAPEDIKADFRKMIDLTPKIQLAKLYV